MFALVVCGVHTHGHIYVCSPLNDVLLYAFIKRNTLHSVEFLVSIFLDLFDNPKGVLRESASEFVYVSILAKCPNTK